MFTEWNDDLEIPLNKIIKEIWDCYSPGKEQIPQDFIDKLRNIYEMGFEEGQAYVYSIRAGKYERERVPLDPNTIIISN
jgi:hypothetical protein